jgi:hypothetical protein
MPRPAVKILLIALLAATACGSQDNIVFGLTAAGTTSGGQTWPQISFQDVNSVFGSQVSLFDADGHPTGDQAWVVIVSNQDNFCETLKANKNLFREPAPFAYQALLLFLPIDRIGTFVIGRPGDEGTFGELIGSAGKPTDLTAPNLPPPVFTSPPTQIILENISLTNWDNGSATGTFDLGFVDPTNTQTYEFSGRFSGDSCDGLDGTLLP